ncbi:MAG: PHP domain-containing protein [Candidatus Omnitrophica bacterium]|nr:PHP domain-containing protein [Candidatus Omnitrophota bacterium]
MKRIDLHMHTTHSDGSYAPLDLIRYAKQKKLDCVSVTDHDTMTSVRECREEAGRLGLEFIPGIELSAKFEPGTLHLLGYFLDADHPGLQKKLVKIQKARRERNPQIIDKLQKLGVDLSLEEVIQEAYEDKEIPAGRQLGRPHFARALVKKNIVGSLQEAFHRFLAKGSPAYVDKSRLTGAEVISIIHEAGGVVSLAHPKQMKLEGEALEGEIRKLVDQGLDALEVFHSSHGPEDHAVFLRFAKRFNLVTTGGSDFHGTNKSGLDLGFLGSNIRLSYEVVEDLRKRSQKRSSS